MVLTLNKAQFQSKNGTTRNHTAPTTALHGSLQKWRRKMADVWRVPDATYGESLGNNMFLVG